MAWISFWLNGWGAASPPVGRIDGRSGVSGSDGQRVARGPEARGAARAGDTAAASRSSDARPSVVALID